MVTIFLIGMPSFSAGKNRVRISANKVCLTSPFGSSLRMKTWGIDPSLSNVG